MGKQVEFLENHAHLTTDGVHIRPWGCDFLPANSDAACIRHLQQIQATQEDALATARATDNGDALTFPDA